MVACTTAALLAVILAQIGLLWWVHGATSVMREEWPRTVKASPAQVYVVQLERFWGPVNAIVPKRCREMDKWQKITDTEDEVATAATTRPPEGASGSRRGESRPGNHQHNSQFLPQRQTQLPAPSPQAQQLEPSAPPPSPAPLPETRATPPARLETWQPPAASTSVEAAQVPPAASSPRLAPSDLAAFRTDQATKQELLAGVEDVPHEELLRSGAAARQLGEILVQRCNETMHFEGVSHLHRYFSMITLTNRVTGGTSTAEELHTARIRSHRGLLVGIVVSMVLKYSLKVTDILASVFGHQYVQLWNQGRTTFDKALESLLLHGISILFTLAMQMTLCGLFLSFWREDHFIMTYVPGVGFSLFFVSLVIFCVAMVVDRVKGWMARCGNWYIYTFWSMWLLWMVALTIPMIGYCFYSVNFMFRVSEMDWLHDQADIFSAEFVRASVTAARATWCFLVVAVVDLAVILLLDLKRAGPQAKT